ncbi:hypothetical protein J4558_27590 [Leptolyngbya sp. 15MV]|nr:hypothetical protein J4558_27590 [Leptolyngbya sp. 15MV]
MVWRGAGFEGMENLTWREDVGAALAGAGWALVAEPEFDPMGAPTVYARAFDTATGPRAMTVEFDTPGAFELRCGDSALIALMRAEADGELAPGSPRPLPPVPLDPAALEAWLARIDCADAEIAGAFAQTDQIDAALVVLERRVGKAPEIDAEADYQRRLGTWLRWTMRNSGAISQEELWAVEEAATPADASAEILEATAILELTAELMKAQQARDGKALCNGVRQMAETIHRTSTNSAAREQALNAALEAEARQRGIAID